MILSSYDKKEDGIKTPSIRYPIILSIILAAVFGVIAFIYLFLGLHEVDGMVFQNTSGYQSTNFIIMDIAFMVCFDMLVQLWGVFSSIKNKKSVIFFLAIIAVIAAFFIIYCLNLHVNDFTVLLWVPICFVLGALINFFKYFSNLIKSEKDYHERGVLFVVLNVVFDIVLFSIIVLLMAFFIWFIFLYIILCIIFRREPIGLIVIIITK